MKFSIITPVYNHSEKRTVDAVRCTNSLRSSIFRDFEHIVIDQTEIDEFVFGENEFWIKYFRMPHVERVLAIREALQEAKGEWICFLDSDDIYLPHTLEMFNQVIEENPDHKMFNFGSLHIGRDGKVSARDAFKPAWVEEEKRHEVFGGGTIVNGTYIFHRSVWEELGDFPKPEFFEGEEEKLWNPWDLSMAAQKEFPEIKPLFTVDHPDHPEGYPKELGNPWGQDFYLFYKYTRKYHSLPFDKNLYVVYCK